MNYEGSFWIKLEDKSFDKIGNGMFFKQNHNNIIPIEITYRDQYLNISENRKINRILIERYSNNTLGIYISAVKHQYMNYLYNALVSNYAGCFSIIHTYGPLAISHKLQTEEHDKATLKSIIAAIEHIETINPYTLRQSILNNLSEGATIEY